MSPNPMTSSPDELAKFIIGTGMTLTPEENQLLTDCMNVEKYVYWGCNHNVSKLHELRILFWQAVGYSRL